MRKIILDFPKQFRVGLESANQVKVRGKFSAVLVCGVGGSALPGDVLKIWLENYKINLPVFIRRNYSLPYYIDKKYLIVCISYSGNTEEPLSSFREAVKKNLKIVGIGSGGKLEELCKNHKVPFAKVPAGFQPRMALGFQFAALIKVLVNCGLLKNDLKDVLALERKLKPKHLENQGKKLAKTLKDKIPAIYASEKWKALARIWKIKLNENAKIPAFYNYFPELDHNEIVGFENIKNKFHMIILRDKADHPRILKGMKITADIIKSKGGSLDFVDLEGSDILSKIFSNLLLSDWVSFYLSLEKKVDPLSLKIVEGFKKSMENR